jgi:hypothetical protein
MPFKDTLASLVLVAAAALLLAGCSSSAGSLSGGAATGHPKPTKSASGPAVLPFNAGKLLGGNATPTFPAGAKGKISAVSEGPVKPDDLGGGSLLFAFRNNTDAAVSHVDFSATARAGGKLVATGTSQGTAPAQIQPGEIGLAYIYFEDIKNVPATGVTYDFTSDSSPADHSSYNTAPLVLSEVSNDGTSIIGTATNKTKEPLTGPYDVEIYCFTGNAITDQTQGFADETGDIKAGDTVSFTVTLYGTVCPTYAVGVSGYFQ